VALGEKGVKTLDDLADLASDELIEILGADAMDEEAANAIIMAARQHWFDGEEEAATADGDAGRPDPRGGRVPHRPDVAAAAPPDDDAPEKAPPALHRHAGKRAQGRAWSARPGTRKARGAYLSKGLPGRGKCVERERRCARTRHQARAPSPGRLVAHRDVPPDLRSRI
jgi:transcription termination factor NusA